MTAGMTGTRQRSTEMKISAWFAGVDPERLAAHRSASRYLVLALGTTLGLVTGPIVLLSVGSYAFGSLPETLGVATRLLIAVPIGAAWMVAIWTIDRALIISSDAIGSERRAVLCVGLALRIGLAAILASIFSNQLVQFLYAPMLDTTAQHMALDQRQRDAEQLARLHGLPVAEQGVVALEAKAKALAEQHRVLPNWIVDKFTAVDACDKQARQLANRVNRGPTPQGWRALSQKRAACQRLRTDATRQREEYLQEISVKIRENSELLRAARGRADAAAANVTADRRKIDAGTAAGYVSISARDVAFETLMREHPEVRINARLWWLALLILELLPVMLKMMSRNNPVAAEAQADLAEGASLHRLRATRLQALEERYASVLTRADVQRAIDDVTAEYAVGLSRVTAFREFIDHLVQDHLRQRDVARAAPDLEAQAHAAYLEAIASAFDSMRKRQPFAMAAE
jgi:hypothetical protein